MNVRDAIACIVAGAKVERAGRLLSIERDRIETPEERNARIVRGARERLRQSFNEFPDLERNLLINEIARAYGVKREDLIGEMDEFE